MWEWRTIARSPTVRSAVKGTQLGRMADGEEVERAVEIALAQGEVRGRDRRGEAIVEGLGEAEARVDPVPAETQCQLVGAQLAGVEEAEQLDPREPALAKRPKLGR